VKLADDALLGIMACLRKGLAEGVDISKLLREMELVEQDGRLILDPQSDPWRKSVGEEFWS
jgi:hypothetical protein